ncbi:cell division protein FtsL [Peribacillus frigoritolerans]|uniref:cell division protein FtsL n=1 Tax=Peribacillus frigoritolerans TaxID=450367 RepID=UPI002231E090|nr:cell division protein FtsL [Peribacillus frigoritolerans]MDF1998591.1 cell division protein FtsL [Peribacillus frigoritolerans]UZD48359.1 cell division protein FtsL [Peribacillus frigoritolerans]
MSSIAKKVQEQQYEDQQQQQTQQTVVIRKAKISIGEVFLLCALAIMVTFMGVKIVSNQAAIYETNKEIQLVETSIEKQGKVNDDLEVQVAELSTYERIWKKAAALGFKLNENNVKGVQ